MENNYITFSPHHAGLSNVIMSYELALSIAYITKRTLILPPNCYLYNISKSDKTEDFIDIWQIFDKNKLKKYFNCIDYYEVPEFVGKYDLLKTNRSYIGNISKIMSDVFSVKFYNYLCESDAVLTFNFSLEDDFKEFCQKRNVIVLSDIKNKFLNFDNNLFGCYWYHVYPGDFEKRNKLKCVINDIFKYSDKFYLLSKNIFSKIGKYNAVHIRRTDFLTLYNEQSKSILTSEQLLTNIKSLFDNKLPLYISTDEEDKSFFDILKSEYKIYFQSDFELDCELDKLNSTVLEQVICSEAERFYGTYLSTYSKRINIMRGLSGKKSFDNIFVNKLDGENIDFSEVNPWKSTESRRWGWWQSSHSQWMSEISGSYKDTYLLSPWS